MAASPGDYCDISPERIMGIPSSVACGSNGASQRLFNDLAALDQDAIVGGVPVVDGMSHGTVGSIPIGKGFKIDRDPGVSIELYAGEGLDSWAGGTYTSKYWSRVGGSLKDVGGTNHECWGTYTPSAHDLQGLNGAQATAVMEYNQCNY
jgi:hypothetical protein